MASVGMMEGAYFVGRSELLAWANSLLASSGGGGVSMTKVEQFASGEHYCRLLATAHPRGASAVRLEKVSSKAVNEADFIKNYKELQRAFDKLKIDKHIPVDRLVKGRALDNLEFLQWIKHYCDTVAGSLPMAPNKASGGDSGEGCVQSSSASVIVRHSAPITKSTSSGRETPSRKAPVGRELTPATHGTVPAATTSQIVRLERELAEMKMRCRNMEQEREFYFRKLRDIEKLLGSYPDGNENASDAPIASDRMSADVTNTAQVARAVKYILFAEDDIEPFGEALRILTSENHGKDDQVNESEYNNSNAIENSCEETNAEQAPSDDGDKLVDDQEGGLCAEAALFAESLAASNGDPSRSSDAEISADSAAD